jgi:flagellar motor switch protein FliN
MLRAKPSMTNPMTDTPASDSAPRKVIRYETLEEGIAQLPSYTRSLLKVRLPVSVRLATCKQQVSRVLEMGHGSIIQFEKGYNEPLEVEVGGQIIAYGEAVKVGEKFGLRVTSIKLPDERFQSLEQLRKQAS